MPVRDLYPIGTQALCLEPMFLGRLGTVTGYDRDRLKVDIEPMAADIRFTRRLVKQFKEEYFTLNNLSRSLNISHRALSKLTASVKFQPGNLNLGLNIKFSGRNQQVRTPASYSTTLPNSVLVWPNPCIRDDYTFSFQSTVRPNRGVILTYDLLNSLVFTPPLLLNDLC